MATFEQLPALIADSYGLIPYKEYRHVNPRWLVGYHFEFPNGLVLSVQCGPCTYSDHHDDSLDFLEFRYTDKDYVTGCLVAEIAIIGDECWYTEDMQPTSDPIGYQTVDDVLSIIEKIMEFDS